MQLSNELEKTALESRKKLRRRKKKQRGAKAACRQAGAGLKGTRKLTPSERTEISRWEDESLYPTSGTNTTSENDPSLPPARSALLQSLKDKTE